MKIELQTQSTHNTRLILIYAGWSADERIARHIDLPGWDVAVVHDYSDFTLDTSILNRYYTIYLFAWSLGVYASALTLPADRITAAYAINGTLHPVDETRGISPDIYYGTADHLSERNLLKFRMRMMRDRRQWEEVKEMFEPEKSAEKDGSKGEEEVQIEERIENLRQQLYNIGEASKAGRPISSLPWVRAYISEDDKIFPAASQQRAWGEDPDVERVELYEGHYVDIEQIIKMVIPDREKVSEKFSKASISYDTHAIAQYSAAIKLATQIGEMRPKPGGEILEIGCGTGLFTKEYADMLRPAHATFVDITPTGPFGIAPTEEYYIEDAEEWIEKRSERWDAILSASCIQWFADLPRFLHQCSLHLKEGGILGVSSFLPGNMEELDQLRPSPLRYASTSQLEGWLQADYEEIKIVEDEIIVEFESVREMLMHLKHTGVGGSAPTGTLSIGKMKGMNRLTYRPVYITARKKG